jgi:NAD(P)-dependent dehydrogenase (short-subunit alcohol dehydrogenase family)
MGELTGKNVLLTGANAGIGQATALELGRRGARLFLANRSAQKSEAVLAALAAQGSTATFLPLDLSDLASVKACAEDFLARGEKLDVLVNNAGVAGASGQTKQGFELAFGINHLGHFLLTQKLLPALNPHARIVVVASRAHERATLDGFAQFKERTQSVGGIKEYGVSKLCNVLHVKELARRLPVAQATTYALHPGVIASEIWRGLPSPLRGLMKLFMRSVEDGARASVLCATSPSLAGETGQYYDEDGSPRRCNRLAEDPQLAARLWAQSEEWVAPFA